MEAVRACAAWLVLALAGCDGIFDLEHIDPPGDAGGDAAAQTGLVAYFPMDEISTDGVVEDVVGVHDGMCVSGQCPTIVAGMRGGALLFDGAADVVNALSSPALDGGAFTVAFWARLDHAPTADDYACAVNKRYGAALDNSWQFCASYDTWKFYTGSTMVSLPMVAYTEDHHFAATWSDKTMELRLYFDGYQFGPPTTVDIAFDAGRIVIGADVDNTSALAWFPGAIDEVRIYDRVLDAPEIVPLASD